MPLYGDEGKKAARKLIKQVKTPGRANKVARPKGIAPVPTRGTGVAHPIKPKVQMAPGLKRSITDRQRNRNQFLRKQGRGKAYTKTGERIAKTNRMNPTAKRKAKRAKRMAGAVKTR